MRSIPTLLVGGEALPSSDFPRIRYWHSPFPDAPNIRIPVRASLEAPLELNEPAKCPALVEACAAFALGCIGEAELALARFKPSEVAPGDQWTATELRLRLLAAHGDWKSAADCLAHEWPWFMAAMRTGSRRPRRVNIAPILVAHGAGHHPLALEVGRFLARLDNPLPHVLHKVATEEAHFRRPARAVKALWTACVRHKHPTCAGAFIWDAGLRRMFEHFGVHAPGKKSREYLFGVLKNFDEVSIPFRPATLNLPTFRAMPREFVELFSYDPQLMFYRMLPATELPDPELSRRYDKWQFDWWQEGLRLALNIFRAPGQDYVPKGTIIMIKPRR